MHWVHRHIIPQAYSSLPFGIERRLLEQLPPLEQSPSPPSAGLGFQLGGGGTPRFAHNRGHSGWRRGVRGGYLLRLEHVLWPERSLSCAYTVRVGTSGCAAAPTSQAGRVRTRCHGVAHSRPIASLDPALATGTASESARRRSMQRRASSPVERDHYGEVV